MKMKNATSNEMGYKGMSVFPKPWMIPAPAYKKDQQYCDSFILKE